MDLLPGSAKCSQIRWWNSLMTNGPSTRRWSISPNHNYDASRPPPPHNPTSVKNASAGTNLTTECVAQQTTNMRILQNMLSGMPPAMSLGATGSLCLCGVYNRFIQLFVMWNPIADVLLALGMLYFSWLTLDSLHSAGRMI